jgi:outer membrane protein TolC
MRFEREGLSLLDAVRLALEHDPAIRLRAAETDQKAGVAREASGEFDATLRGDLTYQYRREELAESIKQRERLQRQEVDKAIQENESLATDLGKGSTYLSDPKFLTDPRGVNVGAGIQNANLKADLEMVRAQVLLLNDLIARSTDPAIRQDLTEMRQGVISSSLSRLSAGMKEISDAMPRLKQARADWGEAPENQWQRQASGKLDVSKKLRSGIVLDPFVNWDYSSGNYVGKTSTDVAKGGQGIKPLHKAELGFDVVVPLRRGRGSASVAATERAAAKDHEAARLSYLHQKSRSVLDTVVGYWDLRSAEEQLDVLRRSVKLQENLATMTRALVKAKQLPRAEETRVLASLADAQARLESGERRLREAQVGLARVMGIALADLEGPPRAADPFPAPPQRVGAEGKDVAEFVTATLGRRYDLKSLERTWEAAGLLVQGARIDTRPLLNLNLRAWGNAISEDEFNFDKWEFRSGKAGLELERPFKNDQLQGRRVQREADLTRAEIDLRDLQRKIALGVLQAAKALGDTAQQLRRSDEAVRQYDRTVEDEQARFKLGESTLLDMILTEQQTTNARVARISAGRDYASLLAQLRYEAGLLVEEQQGVSTVSGPSLVEVPAPLAGADRADESAQ